jgi:hypothetical protein
MEGKMTKTGMILVGFVFCFAIGLLVGNSIASSTATNDEINNAYFNGIQEGIYQITSLEEFQNEWRGK